MSILIFWNICVLVYLNFTEVETLFLLTFLHVCDIIRILELEENPYSIIPVIRDFLML